MSSFGSDRRCRKKAQGARGRYFVHELMSEVYEDHGPAGNEINSGGSVNVWVGRT